MAKLPIYHGTNEEFTKFIFVGKNNTIHQYFGDAIYYTDSIDTAKYYGKNIKVFYLDEKEIDYTLNANGRRIDLIAQNLRDLIKKGGIIKVKNVADANREGTAIKIFKYPSVGDNEFKYLKGVYLHYNVKRLSPQLKNKVKEARDMGIDVIIEKNHVTNYTFVMKRGNEPLTQKEAKILKKIGFHLEMEYRRTPLTQTTYVFSGNTALEKLNKAQKKQAPLLGPDSNYVLLKNGEELLRYDSLEMAYLMIKDLDIDIQNEAWEKEIDPDDEDGYFEAIEKNDEERERVLEEIRQGNYVTFFAADPDTTDQDEYIFTERVEETEEAVKRHLSSKRIKYSMASTGSIYVYDMPDEITDDDGKRLEEYSAKHDIRISDHDANLVNKRNNPHIEIELSNIDDTEEFVEDLARFIDTGYLSHITQYIYDDAPLSGPQRFTKVKEIPRSSIITAPDLFQGRTDKFAKETVDKIVREGYDKSQEPIVVWWDDDREKYIVISGHSRWEASEILYKKGDKSLKKMPVKVFLSDLDEAIEYALLESNRSGTGEGLKSDLKAYKIAVEKGYNRERLKGLFKPESYLKMLQNIAPLNENGKFLQYLGESQEQSFPYLRRNAQWVGVLRKTYPQITDRHESEIFDYLYSKEGQRITKDRFFSLIDKKVMTIDFDPEKSLNLKNVASTNALTDPIRERIDEKEAEIREFQRKRSYYEDLIVRAKQEGLTKRTPEFKDKVSQLNKTILRKLEEKKKLETDMQRVDKNTPIDLFSQQVEDQPPRPDKSGENDSKKPPSRKAPNAGGGAVSVSQKSLTNATENPSNSIGLDKFSLTPNPENIPASIVNDIHKNEKWYQINTEKVLTIGKPYSINDLNEKGINIEITEGVAKNKGKKYIQNVPAYLWNENHDPHKIFKIKSFKPRLPYIDDETKNIVLKEKHKGWLTEYSKIKKIFDFVNQLQPNDLQRVNKFISIIQNQFDYKFGGPRSIAYFVELLTKKPNPKTKNLSANYEFYTSLSHLDLKLFTSLRENGHLKPFNQDNTNEIVEALYSFGRDKKSLSRKAPNAGGGAVSTIFMQKNPQTVLKAVRKGVFIAVIPAGIDPKEAEIDKNIAIASTPRGSSISKIANKAVSMGLSDRTHTIVHIVDNVHSDYFYEYSIDENATAKPRPKQKTHNKLKLLKMQAQAMELLQNQIDIDQSLSGKKK